MRHSQTKDAIYQASFLSVVPVPAVANEKVFADVFRKLYYHFYANSHASRAERIMADLSNLLLCKIAGERTGNSAIDRFVQGEGSANNLLIPFLKMSFPQLVEAGEQFYLQDEILRQGLRELAPLSFHAAPAHILGEAFQALMGPRLRGDKGQFFTPKSLARAMIAILDPPPTAKIVDPACGTGGFLVEVQATQAQSGPPQPSLSGRLIGMDKDRDLCRLAEATLEIVAPDRAVILNRNSLDWAALAALPTATTPLGADYVITNPPFGAKIKVTERDILRQYALGHKWTLTATGWLEEGNVREAQDPQILFLELCIKLLRPDGRLGIVLPEGVFGNHTLGYVWDFVRRHGTITALLDCPRTTFQPSTDTKTNVLFFRKSPTLLPAAPVPAKVWTAVALHCGHDRRGRSTKVSGEGYPDDFASIGAEYSRRTTAGGFWQQSTISNPYYLVPRYYDQAPLHELTAEATRSHTQLISLGELVKRRYISVRKGHEVGAEAYGTGDIPFVRTSDIANYEVSTDSTRGVSEDIYQQYADQQRLAPGDILLVADGRYRIGRLAILHEHSHRCIVQSHLRIISVTATAPFRAVELLYLLNLPMVQHQIRNLVFIQSTLGSLGNRLHEICVPLPEQTVDWQRSIEEFAGLIESRAALLRRLRAFDPGDYEL